MDNEKILDFLGSQAFYGPLVTIGVALIIYNMIRIILSGAVVKNQSELEKKRRNTIIVLINSILKYIVLIIVLMVVLNIYGIDTKALVAGLGIAGVVIGFALQDAIKDVIGGINVILENYYILGDLVRYHNFSGEVIEFGLKSTKIKASNGEVLVVANRMVDEIVNLSQKNAVLNFEIPTAASCDSKKVQDTIKQIVLDAASLDGVDAEGSAYLGIEHIDGTSITYSFCIKCKQHRQFELRREILALVKEAYDKEKLKFN